VNVSDFFIGTEFGEQVANELLGLAAEFEVFGLNILGGVPFHLAGESKRGFAEDVSALRTFLFAVGARGWNEVGKWSVNLSFAERALPDITEIEIGLLLL